MLPNGPCSGPLRGSISRKPCTVAVGLSRKELAILVQSVLDELADALIGGESVKLSSFGRFLVRAKSERIGRNPKTGIEVPITQRRVMVFKPSNVLKARINGLAVADEEDD